MLQPVTPTWGWILVEIQRVTLTEGVQDALFLGFTMTAPQTSGYPLKLEVKKKALSFSRRNLRVSMAQNFVELFKFTLF